MFDLRLNRIFRKIMRAVIDEFMRIIPRMSSTEVCLVRLDAIGDFILWLDAAKEYRRIYPRRRIILIANSQWSDLAELIPYWDEVWPINVNRFVLNLTYRLSVLFKIRRQGFEIAIHPTFSRTYFIGDSILRTTGAKVRLGWTGDGNNILPKHKNISDGWYTTLFQSTTECLFELDRNKQFLHHSGFKDFQMSVHQLPNLIVLSPDLQMEKPYFVIFPGSAWIGRQWSPKSFSDLIDCLHNDTGWLPVLCGGQNEHSLCSEITRTCVTKVVNLAGFTTLAQLVEIIRVAQIVIGNETSAIHIAAAVSTKSICILGGGHFGRFMPYPDSLNGELPVPVFHKMACYGCNWQCNQPHSPEMAVPCISQIPVESVLKQVAILINRGGETG